MLKKTEMLLLLVMLVRVWKVSAITALSISIPTVHTEIWSLHSFQECYVIHVKL